MVSINKTRIIWLKIMYSLTIVIAGVVGAMLLISPSSTQMIFNSDCPQILSGLIGSIYLAFALISAFGLRDPIKFAPLLLMQLIYKSIWLCFIALPLLIENKISSEIVPLMVVFLVVIIGDAIATPFRLIFRQR